MYKKRLNQVGDTIVEVLIAVVIVGLAIGLGYGVASRSLKANQQAQERGEALKQVEGQIERLKKLAASGNTQIFDGSAFCIAGNDDNQVVPQDAPPADIAADPLGDNYEAACKNGLYNLSITPENSDNRQFNVKARWFGLGGTDKEEVIIKYRIYPAS